jgi:hypothetical protein
VGKMGFEEFLKMNGKKFIDVVKILPEVLPSGKKILWKEVEDGKIEIFVDKHSAKGGNAKPIKIKRFIEINEDLFLLFGLWMGDGIRKEWGSEKVFGFSNTEISLHKLFLNLSASCLSIKPEKFSCILSLPENNEELDKKLKLKISSFLEIPLKNFWNSRINPTRNLVGVDVKINSRLLSFLMHLILEKVKVIALKNEFFSAKMLQGIIASEANIHVRSDSGRLGEISIAAEGEEKREFIRRLLLNLKINPSKDKTIEHQQSVLIHGLSNFKKVKERNLVNLHPKKLEDFEKGLKGFKMEQSRKGECRLKVLQLLAEAPRTRQELGKLLNRSPNTIKTEALFILEKQGLVERGEINNKHRVWKITQKGLDILNSNNPLEELRNRK